MTPREQAAYNAGIEAVRQAALTIEVRDDARGLRQQAAVAALQGLAEGARELMLGREHDPIKRVFAAIAADPASSGTIECPTCQGRLRWLRDSHNGHLHGECETAGCLRVMQ